MLLFQEIVLPDEMHLSACIRKRAESEHLLSIHCASPEKSVKSCQTGARNVSFVSLPQLAVIRKRAGLSQRELADYVGVSMNTISRLERGAKARYGTLLLLAQALHIPPTRLCRCSCRRLTTPRKDT